MKKYPKSLIPLPPQKGVSPVKPDRRDFSHARLCGYHLPAAAVASMEQLPETLGRKRLPVENQNGYGFCTAFSTSKSVGYQERTDQSPEHFTAQVGRVAGAPIMQGTDARNALKAAVSLGTIPKTLVPHGIAEMKGEYYANYFNWPKELQKEAYKRIRGSYFVVDGPRDHFDNIRLALFHAQKDNSTVLAVSKWYDEWDTTNPDMPVGRGWRPQSGYHMYNFIDWEQRAGAPALVLQNSFGNWWGDQGFTYMSRETANAAFSDTGAYLFMFRKIDWNNLQNLMIHNYTVLDMVEDMFARLGEAVGKLLLLQYIWPK